MDNTMLDVKALAQLPEFQNLTVEEAIRLLGEKEKTSLNQEREKVLNDLKAKLDEKVATMKSGR
jgi:hypothetical protein